MSKKYRAGDQLTLTIEKIVPRGYGLAFAEELTVFVALAAVGDRVDATLREVKGKTAFAEIDRVIEPSPDRVDPVCGYFGSCGGCDFMQMTYDAQLRGKVAMIRDCIERIAKLKYDREINMIASPEILGYRLRAQWHANTREHKIGYYRRNSRELIDIEKCPILLPDLQTELDQLRSDLPWGAFFSEKAQIDAACGDSGDVSVFSPELLEPTRDISFTAAGEKYSFSARSFFQGNRYLIDDLVAAATPDVRGRTALDLYCGVGLFTIPLGRRFDRVIGVEENADAIEFARRNSETAGLTNIQFHVDSVRDFLENAELEHVDFALLDPPRAGTEKDTIERLIGLSPPTVSYVACEPSILARDLRRFADAGYRIETITAIDLFPQTHHVETVAILKRDQI